MASDDCSLAAFVARSDSVLAGLVIVKIETSGETYTLRLKAQRVRGKLL